VNEQDCRYDWIIRNILSKVFSSGKQPYLIPPNKASFYNNSQTIGKDTIYYIMRINNGIEGVVL